MPKDRVINSQSFQDGKIVLYQLENRPKKLWLCRLKVPNGAVHSARSWTPEVNAETDYYRTDQLPVQNQTLRIAISGPNASGKTTLAKAISEHYAIPVLEEGMGVLLGLVERALSRAGLSRQVAGHAGS